MGVGEQERAAVQPEPNSAAKSAVL